VSGAVYNCGDERRRALVLDSALPHLTGIDYVEVEAGPPLKLILHFVKGVALSPADLDATTVQISGGDRLPPPQGEFAAKPSAAACTRLDVTFPAGSETDFSIYTLALVRSGTDQRPPPYIDRRLAAVDFSFKVDCPSDFDCAESCPDSSAVIGGPVLDYTARDYDQLRQLMLDRMAALVPGFGGDQAADFTTTLVEVLAYDADQASYRLDWVGTEAFLDTARSRSSLRRHARLVDYAIGEGASARTFVSVDFTPGAGVAADGMVLANGTPLLPRDAALSPVLGPGAYRQALQGAPIIFETIADAPLWAWRNAIAIHSWGDDQCLLCKGATAATLIDRSAGAGVLKHGDLLLLAETVSPETGLAADARRDRRQVVRLTKVTPAVDVLAKPPLVAPLALLEIEWHPDDALQFDLAIQVQVPGGTLGSAFEAGAVARANVVIAEHGASLPPAAALGLNPAEADALRPALDPAVPPDVAGWSPVVRLPGTLALPMAHIGPPPADTAPASTLLDVDPAKVVPAVALDDDFESWTARPDLLASGRFGRDFVVETGIDGAPLIRVGYGVDGLAPTPGAALGVHGRFGGGTVGNLGPDALAHVVLPVAQGTAGLRITNPLPARGGADPESAAAIRSRAPEAFRRQERAITAADYARFAKAIPGVADAIAVPRWTGAWWTMMVYVDRVGGAAVDASFEAQVAAGLERYRMMGFDVALSPARAAPLDIEIEVCAGRDSLAADVAWQVRRALSPSAGGAAALFHPDRFGFETALQLSQLIAAVMAVPGVSAARVTRFKRWARVSTGELAYGVIRPTGPEILKLADDPSRPEMGRLAIRMGSGK
jgi:hypothetical protein